MREKETEMKLVQAANRMGGIAPKLVCPGFDGMPDRLLLLPGGRMAFAELKAPGKEPRPIQARRIQQLRHLGDPVYVIDRPEQIGGVLREVSAP